MSKVMCLGVRGELQTQLDDNNIVSPNSTDLGEGREVGRLFELSVATKTAIGDLTYSFGDEDFDNVGTL